MKNKLTDLNDHLFAQLERLGDEDLKGEDLEKEIARTNAIKTVATQIVETQGLALRAQRLLGDGQIRKAPAMLGLDKD